MVAIASLDDAILSQLVKLQVAEGFPRANHGDICGEQKMHQHKSQPCCKLCSCSRKQWGPHTCS